VSVMYALVLLTRVRSSLLHVLASPTVCCALLFNMNNTNVRHLLLFYTHLR